jgi:hypothetical protein
MATFTELVQAVQKHPKLFTVGTVTYVDEDTMSCKITPEDGGEAVDNVPIRVMRHANEIGFSVVPKVGTEVIVMWLDEYRPTIFQVHEWDKVIVKNKGDVGMVIKGDKIWVGKEDFGLEITPPIGPARLGSGVTGINVESKLGPVTVSSPGATITLPKAGKTMTLAVKEGSALKLGDTQKDMHPVAWADVLETYLDKDNPNPAKSLLKWLENQLGSTPPEPDKFKSDEVKVS